MKNQDWCITIVHRHVKRALAVYPFGFRSGLGMRLLKIHVFTTLMLICFCQDAVAQSASGLIDSGTAKRFGMEIMWRTQVRMWPVSKLQSIAQVFGKSKTLVKYVVTFEDIVEEFYEDDVDRFGREIGVSGA